MKKGFTLIELLVVIAIIGILSAVVLASLNTARNKGSDAAIQADLSSVRSQAAIYFNENGNYGTVTEATTGCTAPNTFFVLDTTVATQVAAAENANGTTLGVVCNTAANGEAYAVSAALVANSGSYFCIDSAGVATTTATGLGANTTCS
ncbi:type II secretion system protein [Candidatus Kaiserbacteria bacterium]|nr:type II secretion system protein [Candidatus Kaiserbacteria bacterium]